MSGPNAIAAVTATIQGLIAREGSQRNSENAGSCQ